MQVNMQKFSFIDFSGTVGGQAQIKGLVTNNVMPHIFNVCQHRNTRLYLQSTHFYHVCRHRVRQKMDKCRRLRSVSKIRPGKNLQVSLTRRQQDVIKPINSYRAAIIPDLWTRSAGKSGGFQTQYILQSTGTSEFKLSFCVHLSTAAGWFGFHKGAAHTVTPVLGQKHQ